MNLKNSNSEFQDFTECDFNKHWSFSNFNRQMITANIIKERFTNPKVVELGAGDSRIKDIYEKNFKGLYQSWHKFDADKKYKGTDCEILDISSFVLACRLEEIKPDVIICEEVLEHLDKPDKIYKVLLRCFNRINDNGIMIISVPTPPFDGKYEDRVWPDDHAWEPINCTMYHSFNKFFKVVKQIGWSIEEREFYKALETDDFARKFYCKLKGAYPESFARALLSSLLDNNWCRQQLYVGIKRRGGE